MILNLNDVSSILAWWRVCPDRHSSYLDQKLRFSPEFGATSREAQRLIDGSDEMQALLARSTAQRQQQDAYQAQRRAAMSSVALLRTDVAMAA